MTHFHDTGRDNVARCRFIKPEFFEDTTIAELSMPARVLFIGLWTLVDSGGFTIDDPRMLKAKIFPYDTALDIEPLLVELHRTDTIRRFEAVDKHGWIWVKNFTKHQHIHPNEKPSLAPKFDLREGRFSGNNQDRSGNTQDDSGGNQHTPQVIEHAKDIQHSGNNQDNSGKNQNQSGVSTSTSTSTVTSTSSSTATRARETGKRTDFAFDEAFVILRDDYPPERVQDSVLIRQTFIRAFDGLQNGSREALFDKMLGRLSEHKHSAQWKILKHIPMFGKWIEESRWLQTLDAIEQQPERSATVPVNASQVGKRTSVPAGQPLDPRKPRR